MLSQSKIYEHQNFIVQQIKNASTTMHPFPYLIVDDFLPFELTNLLSEEYQDSSSFSSSEHTLAYHNPNRFADNIENYGGRLKKYSNNFLFQIFNNKAIPSILIKRFDVKSFSNLYFRGQVTRDTEKYSLGVHTDVTKKLFTLIVYLNQGADKHIKGTSIFASPYGLESDGFLAYSPKFFTHEVEVEPLFNRALIFQRSSKSFHGVLKGDAVSERFTLQLNYFFTPN
jgi:hypothetical protein